MMLASWCESTGGFARAFGGTVSASSLDWRMRVRLTTRAIDGPLSGGPLMSARDAFTTDASDAVDRDPDL